MLQEEKFAGLGQPVLSKDAETIFQPLKSMFVGNNDTSEISKRVESISWSNMGDFIVTNCLAANSARVWDVKSGRLVLNLPSNGRLRKVQFSGIADEIWGIENENKVVMWERERESSESPYGTTWKRSKEILLPENYSGSIISDLLIADASPSDIFVLSFLSKDSQSGILWKIEGGYPKTFNLVKSQDSVTHVKWIENLPNTAVFYKQDTFPFNDEIKINRYEDSRVFVGSDLAYGSTEPGSNKIGIEFFVSNATSEEGFAITVWDVDSDGLTKLGFKQHWSSFKDAPVVDGTFSLIELPKWSPRNTAILYAVDYKFLYKLKIKINKRKYEVSGIGWTKLNGHEKEINRLDLEGPHILANPHDPLQQKGRYPAVKFYCLTTSSEDGTIRIWFPEKKEKEFGCIFNCHPHLNPFKWKYSNVLKKKCLCYADVNGYVHVLEYTKTKDNFFKRIFS